MCVFTGVSNLRVNRPTGIFICDMEDCRDSSEENLSSPKGDPYRDKVKKFFECL